jgi:hypothetical protein
MNFPRIRLWARELPALICDLAEGTCCAIAGQRLGGGEENRSNRSAGFVRRFWK